MIIGTLRKWETSSHNITQFMHLGTQTYNTKHITTHATNTQHKRISQKQTTNIHHKHTLKYIYAKHRHTYTKTRHKYAQQTYTT